MISGGQLKRTGTTEDPAPAAVYPTMPWCRQAPDPKALGKTALSVRGMPPEIVTLHIFKPPFWPDPERFILHGILSALSLEGIPCASNVVLCKIQFDDPLKDKLGYFTPEEIEAEGHRVDILNYIDNNLRNSFDVLTAT